MADNLDVFDNVLAKLGKVAEVAAYLHIVDHHDADSKGMPGLAPEIKARAWLFGFGKGEEDAWSDTKDLLEIDPRNIIERWFDSLKPWQQTDTQLHVARKVKRQKKYDGALLFLTVLADFGPEDNHDAIRTQRCIKDKIFAVEEPGWHKLAVAFKKVDWTEKGLTVMSALGTVVKVLIGVPVVAVTATASAANTAAGAVENSAQAEESDVLDFEERSKRALADELKNWRK
jgi:hypothetical protein